MSIRDSFFIYEGLRKAFLLGIRVKPILQALDIRKDDCILDAGCGYGYFFRHCQGCNYTGVDKDPSRVAWARKNIGENDRRRFIVADITQTGLPAKSFDKAIGFGLLHHLPDDVARRSLAELGRLVKDRLVFSDPVYSRYHFVNNILCRMDRGNFVRQSENYLGLYPDDLRILDKRSFWAHNGLAKYYLVTASPQDL